MPYARAGWMLQIFRYRCGKCEVASVRYIAYSRCSRSEGEYGCQFVEITTEGDNT